MSNKPHDLSGIKYTAGKSHREDFITLVVSKWNIEVTQALLDGAIQTLLEAGVLKKNISVSWVPGSFELPLGAKVAIDSDADDAVICLGCVIQGETKHFDFICSAVAQGIMTLNLETKTPVIFGVLTPNTQQQALDRAGGKLGNKGSEAAVAALEMIDLIRSA